MDLVVALVCLLAGGVVGASVCALSVARRGAAARPPEPGRVPSRSDGARTPALAGQVLGAIDVGVVVVDREDTVVYANPAARRVRVVEGDRLTMPGLAELARSATDSGQPDSLILDLAVQNIGPELLTHLVTAIPLNEDGRIGSVLLTFSDITEARRLERVRRDFVANVSHELKTPVGALTLLAEAVQDAADDPDAVQRFSQRMQREGARLGRLVQELIELSRLQGADPLPGPQLVSVGRVMSEAVDRSRLLAEQSGITVLDRAERGLLVRGNETQLATAVANLVDNAIAYSSGRTRVSVSARAVTDEHGADWVEIAVTDQGIGIAESDLDRVFERFFRVDPARSRATGGTGLGLAIVKHIATNHGGGVSVWSVLGEGSTFTIKLPLAGRDEPDGDDDQGEAVAGDEDGPEHEPIPAEPVRAALNAPGRSAHSEAETHERTAP